MLNKPPKLKAFSKQIKKPVTKQMLSLVDAKLVRDTKLKWSVFKSFSVLPGNKTLRLWHKYKFFSKTRERMHILIYLMIANKICAEKNKTFRQISRELSDLISKQLNKSSKIGVVTIGDVNRLLRIRSVKETQRKGKHGGRREKIPVQTKQKMIEELKKGINPKIIATKFDVNRNTVYLIGVQEGIYKQKEGTPRKYRLIPEETEKKIQQLIDRGLTLKQIAEFTGVAISTVHVRKNGKKSYY